MSYQGHHESLAKQFKTQGLELLRENRAKDAIKFLKKSACIILSGLDAAGFVGVAEGMLGDRANGIAWLRRFLCEDPLNATGRYNYINLLLLDNTQELALHQARVLAVISPSSHDAVVGLLKASNFSCRSADLSNAIRRVQCVVEPGRFNIDRLLRGLAVREAHSALDQLRFRSRKAFSPMIPALPDAARSPQDDAERLVRTILSARPRREPFSFAVVRPFLPAGLYQIARRHIPDRATLSSLPSLPNYPKRRGLSNDQSHGSNALATLLSTIASDPTLDAMLRLFDAEELRREIQDAGFVLRGSARMTIDERNFELGPHRDHPSRLCSGLIYLPMHESQKMEGTIIYRRTRPINFYDWGVHHDFEGFEEVGRVPFSDNTCLLFMNLGEPYHGVSLVKTNSQRAIIQFTFYIERPTPKG